MPGMMGRRMGMGRGMGMRRGFGMRRRGGKGTVVNNTNVHVSADGTESCNGCLSGSNYGNNKGKTAAVLADLYH